MWRPPQPRSHGKCPHLGCLQLEGTVRGQKGLQISILRPWVSSNYISHVPGQVSCRVLVQELTQPKS